MCPAASLRRVAAALQAAPELLVVVLLLLLEGGLLLLRRLAILAPPLALPHPTRRGAGTGPGLARVLELAVVLVRRLLADGPARRPARRPGQPLAGHRLRG